MDDTARQLREQMQRRRAAMEATIMSETGSYMSDADDTMNRGRDPSKTPSRFGEDTTEIQTLGESRMEALVEDLDQGDDMIQNLQTRRQQKKEELSRTIDGSSSAWGDQPQSFSQQQEPSTSSLPASPSGPGPHLQRLGVGEDRLTTSMAGESMNLNASIRERLRSKVRGRQARGGLDETTPERRLKGLRDRPLPTRFDEAGLAGPEEKEEDLDDPALMESIASVNRWKKMARASQLRYTDGMPTAEEAYNFFVGSMDTEDKEPTTDQTTEVHDLGIPVFWGKPPRTPQSKRLEVESTLYKVPSVLSVPFEKKVPEGREPRYLEDEGFYVGRPPPACFSNLNTMEDRLAGTDKKHIWFGEDGHLKRLANPLKDISTRPTAVVAPEDLDPHLQTQWKKAHTEPFDARYIDSSGVHQGHYQIDVDCSTITFTHHPLFSMEHVLASRLQQLYKQYCMRRKKCLSDHLTDKLTALKIALRQIQEDDVEIRRSKNKGIQQGDKGKRVQDYRRQIMDVRRTRDVEDFNDRTLIQNMLQCWKEIKSLREQQGYINTPIKLVVRRQERDKIEEEAAYSMEIEEELQEKKQEYELEYQDKLAAYEADLKEWKRIMKKRKKKTAATRPITGRW